MSYFAYVLKSEATEKIYIGQTNNLEFRLRRHNGTFPSNRRSYTRLNKGPWKLVYSEVFDTGAEARLREKQLKSHHGRDWLRTIIG